jgi:tetratricopeptide (TPR) repeat protein
MRWYRALGSLALVLTTACGSPEGPPSKTTTKPGDSRQATSRDEIPADRLDTILAAHWQGLGHMERYEYAEAARSFREVHEQAPGWIPGSVNLAIALLNQGGTAAEPSPGSRTPAPGRPPTSGFDEALGLLEDALRRDPDNLHAHYCRGIILEYQGRLAKAHADFLFVAEHDSTDGHAWFKAGSTLTDPAEPERPAGPAQAPQLIAFYTKALERNPYLINALYKLQAAYAWAGQRDKQQDLIQLWRRLNPRSNVAGPGESAENFYGDMGRYASVVSPKVAGRTLAERKPEPAPPPRFDLPTPIDVKLPEGCRWAARSSPGEGAIAFDADGDGKLDLYLARAIEGPQGVRDALLINLGDGRFEDATLSAGFPAGQPGIGVAAGDFDADRRIDLFVTYEQGVRLWRNLGGRKFEDVTQAAGIANSAGFSLSARWLDLDQDGDLDLYVVNLTKRELGFFVDPGIPNAVYRNDGKPAAIAGRPQDNWAPLAVAPQDLPATAGLSIAFTPWPDAEALLGGQAFHGGIAALDLDDDRDIDLVLSSWTEDPTAVLNDRLGRFHKAKLNGFASQKQARDLLVTDFDKDGRADLVGVSTEGRLLPWRNSTQRSAGEYTITGEMWPSDPQVWQDIEAIDLDLDTWPDLVGLGKLGERWALMWANPRGGQFVSRPLALGPGSESLVGFAVADLVGDPLPDLLLIKDGEAPRICRNLGNGRHWLALDPAGRWKAGFDHMRSNPHGLGLRIVAEGQGLFATHEHTTTASGLGQSVKPIVLGLGEASSAALLRLRWPDGTMQCELNVAADQKLPLVEHNRKTGSCPVLFTWNGERFVCIGDFLGGGGLGYLVAPGVYGQPDRDEAVAISSDQLRPSGDAYRLSITEPMDEVSYLDQLELEIVDVPPGVSATPDERFAPSGPRPTGEVIAWREAIEPLRATDLKGRDVSENLRAFDRRTVDQFKLRQGWIGYTEEHGIVLDFGDRLSRFSPSDSLVLCLAGWVEYPYSQTNYAASTAGVTLTPPSVERLDESGVWRLIEPDAGYPAGLPRLTTLDLTGKLIGPRCTIRLRTNMECYWDRAFVAVRDHSIAPRITRLAVARADLRYRGYLREVSPDGRLPLLYDYEHVDPAPLFRLGGRLTRLGDVATLLQNDDDRFCVIGPGDEVRLEFDAAKIPNLPPGWTRSYILQTTGYCKDADPFTAASDTVEPLPWRGMPPFPFDPGTKRPADPDFDAYLREFQTRSAGNP